MKIIISHDVDHWEWKDHITDGFLIKFIIKNFYYGLTGKLKLSLAIKRLCSVFKSRISRLEKLLNYEKELGVSSTVFIGVSNALGLSYSKKTAQSIINLVKSMDFKIGIHGIEFDDLDKMRAEKKSFEELSGMDEVGIRIHYLRMSENTHAYMSKLDYCYDSTLSGIINHSSINEMQVFPISIMDVDILCQTRNNIEMSKNKTLDLFREAKSNGQQYFVINFHDNYFSGLYPDHKAWFKWVINYLKEEKYEFTDFYKAVDEMGK